MRGISVDDFDVIRRMSEGFFGLKGTQNGAEGTDYEGISETSKTYGPKM